MASVPQEDYIRQLLDGSFRTESDSENIANDTSDEDEEDHIEVVQEDTVTEREGRMMNKMLIMSSHSYNLNPYQVCLVILVKIKLPNGRFTVLDTTTIPLQPAEEGNI